MLRKYHFPHKDFEDIKCRWEMKQSIDSEWTAPEDEILLMCIKKYGTGNWGLMRKDLPGRSTEAILTRFRVLCPDKARLCLGCTWACAALNILEDNQPSDVIWFN